MTYIVVHHHRWGIDVFFVEHTRSPSDKQIIDACGIEFDDGANDYLEVFHAGQPIKIKGTKGKTHAKVG